MSLPGSGGNEWVPGGNQGYSSSGYSRSYATQGRPEHSSAAPAEPPTQPRRTGAILGALAAGIAIGAAVTAGGFLLLGDDKPAVTSAAPTGATGPQFGAALSACGAGTGSNDIGGDGAQIADGGDQQSRSGRDVGGWA